MTQVTSCLRSVYRGVDDVAGDVDPVFTLFEDVTVQVDLDQVRGCDLVVAKAVLVDQELVVCAGDPRGDVVVDERGHAKMLREPVSGRQVHARPPLRIRVGVGLLRRHRQLHTIIRLLGSRDSPIGMAEGCKERTDKVAAS